MPKTMTLSKMGRQKLKNFYLTLTKFFVRIGNEKKALLSFKSTMRIFSLKQRSSKQNFKPKKGKYQDMG